VPEIQKNSDSRLLPKQHPGQLPPPCMPSAWSLQSISRWSGASRSVQHSAVQNHMGAQLPSGRQLHGTPPPGKEQHQQQHQRMQGGSQGRYLLYMQ